jgi:rod shape determining protein RodA
MGRSEPQVRRAAVDGWLAGAAILLLATGLAIVYSTSQPSAPAGDPLYFVKRQLVYAVAGAVVFLVAAAVDHRVWDRFAVHLYVLGLLLLAAVLVHGHSALGAQRWIQLGPVQLQPSEFAKFLYVVAMAHVLARRSERMHQWSSLGLPLLLTLPYFALVFKQPDLGTGLIFFLILFGMLWMAGAPGGRLVLVFGGGLALAVGLLWAHLRYHVPLPGVHAYQLARLLIFLHPQQDPTGSGWNILQSRIALGSGGVFGLGLLHGPETQLSFLPEPFTDFIFASLTEQLGYVGAASVLVLFLVLVWRLLAAASRSPDAFGALLASGGAAMVAAQVTMNAGMAMGILPVVGVPLPLLSYGGSSLLTTAVTLGAAASVARAGRGVVARRPRRDRTPLTLPPAAPTSPPRSAATPARAQEPATRARRQAAARATDPDAQVAPPGPGEF